MAQTRPYYPPQSSYPQGTPPTSSPPQQISPSTQLPSQPSYYVPPPQRPYPSQQYHPSAHHSIAPSHPQTQARPISRYEQQYHPTIDARNDYPDDDFYSDVEYEDGIDDGYYDNDDGLGDVTKESEKSLSYVWLYIIGMLTCLTIEVITVILSYFLEIVIVAPLMCSIWVFAVILVLCTMASSASSTSTSKHQRSSHIRTQIMSTFLMACAVGIICGLIASISLKQAWYYEAGNYYTQVNPTAPATQYPNAVIADYAQGSYVGKDYTGMVTSGGTRYCAAPIMGSGPGTKGTPISFWAVDTNCCMNTNTGVASPGHIAATCAHWSDTKLEGEIIRNPNDSYISAAFASNTWYKSTSSDGVYYVELLSQGEHDKRQQKRRLTGYLLVALAPICWPVILIFYIILVWIGTCCCGKKNQPTTTRY